MEINNAERLLYGTIYEPFIGSLEKIILKNHICDDIFKIGNDRLGHFLLKIRKSDNLNFIDSIENLKSIKDPENIINKNIGIINKEKFIITISDWIDGKQPIDNDRGKLPLFFSKLAILNKNNIIGGPYTSMYLDSGYFNSIEELVNREVNYHKKYLLNNKEIKTILEVMEILKNGIPCIINEDMNCGNLFITGSGELKIVDTEWIIRGINLYQFQHFDYFGFDGKKWYKIIDEAEECYRAYFETLGISNNEANDQIRAIELLNVLRENTYWKYTGKENDKEIERRIKIVIEKEKYI